MHVYVFQNNMDEQISLSVSLEEEEEEEEQEKEIKTKEVHRKVEEEKSTHGKPLKKAKMEMDESCTSQKQETIKVKMSSNTSSQSMTKGISVFTVRSLMQKSQDISNRNILEKLTLQRPCHTSKAHPCETFY